MVPALIHLIGFKLASGEAFGCNFAVALKKFKLLLLPKGQFPPLLRGSISTLIYFDWLSPKPTDGIVFYCIKPPVLSFHWAFWTCQVVGNILGSSNRKLLGLPAVLLPG